MEARRNLEWAPAVPALAILLLLGVWFAFNADTMLLFAQDMNPIHLVDRWSHLHLPSADDTGYGEYSDHLVWASIYFIISLFFDFIGGSARWVVIAHAFLATPLLFAAFYYLASALTPRRDHAALAAILVFLGDFALFRPNSGYTLSILDEIYYGDINHILAGFSLGALLRRRLTSAIAIAAALALLNITYAFNLAVVIAGFVLWLKPPEWTRKDYIKGAAIMLAGFVIGLAEVMAAMPDAPKAPDIVHDISIRGFHHIAIHTWNTASYIAGMFMLAAMLAYARLYARRIADQREIDVSVLKAFSDFLPVASIVIGLLLYWVLYVLWPALFILISPSKIFMVATIYGMIHAPLAVLHCWRRWPILGIALVAALLAASLFGDVYKDIWFIALVAMGISAVLSYFPRNSSTSTESWRIVVLAMSAVTALVVAIPAGQALTTPLAGEARELRDISAQMDRLLPPQAVVVPARYPNTAKTAYGNSSSPPLRTFSKRAVVEYWRAAYEAYFDSAKQYNRENEVFSLTLGQPYWPQVIAADERLRAADPFSYFTGVEITTSPCCHVSVSRPGASRAFQEPGEKFQKWRDEATPEQISTFARALGADYLFIGHEPNAALPWGPPIASTEHYTVVALPPTAEKQQ